MSDGKKGLTDTILTFAMVATAVSLVVILALTQVLLDSRNDRYEEPPAVVISFLTEFVPLRSLVDQEVVLEKYFSNIDTNSISHEGASPDLMNINAVFRENKGDPVGFRICIAHKNYVEFMLVDADGQDLPCRIGMFYLLNGEGRISSYSLFRLQPVDRDDTEWNGAWL